MPKLRKLNCIFSGAFGYSDKVKGSFICHGAKSRALEILKVLLRAFEGHEWEVKDSEFPELKYLELDDLNIAHSSVSEDA
ncbi:hypothetical protein KY284_023306 [Solanum tuberosum]|nr:hypothetical protein KY284_023306 [Solanum tuberosum]